MKLSGAIFDVDDTLTVSEWVWKGIPEKFLERHGKSAEPGLDETLALLNTAQIGQYFKEHYFPDSRRSAKSIIWEFGTMGAPYYFFNVPLKPGAKKLVKQLHRQNVKLTILSANETTLIKAALFRTGVLKYFDSIFCGKDAENAKDNPMSFERARQRLGTPKDETIVFDDSVYALRTARAAGFKCVAVLNGDETPEELAELKELAEFCVSDFTDLLDKLEGPNK